MPQAMGMQMIMQLAMPIIESLISKITDMISNNQPQSDMEQSTKSTLEKEGYNDKDQQYDVLNQAADHAMGQGKMLEAAILSNMANLFGERA